MNLYTHAQCVEEHDVNIRVKQPKRKINMSDTVKKMSLLLWVFTCEDYHHERSIAQVVRSTDNEEGGGWDSVMIKVRILFALGRVSINRGMLERFWPSLQLTQILW